MPRDIYDLIQQRDELRTQKQILAAELELTRRFLERIPADQKMRAAIIERCDAMRVTLDACK